MTPIPPDPGHDYPATVSHELADGRRVWHLHDEHGRRAGTWTEPTTEELEEELLEALGGLPVEELEELLLLTPAELEELEELTPEELEELRGLKLENDPTAEAPELELLEVHGSLVLEELEPAVGLIMDGPTEGEPF